MRSVLPRHRKIRQVNSSVAMVMPEIGFDDEPTSPVNREDTVTNRNPNSKIISAPEQAPQAQAKPQRGNEHQRQNHAQTADQHDRHRQVALGADGDLLAGAAAGPQVAHAGQDGGRRSRAAPATC